MISLIRFGTPQKQLAPFSLCKTWVKSSIVDWFMAVFKEDNTAGNSSTNACK